MAVGDFNKSIKLYPGFTLAYYERSKVWLYLKEWEKARADLTFAKENSFDIIASFHNDYESVENFEQKTGIQLPGDIAAILRRQ